jgi:hypothetical protein
MANPKARVDKIGISGFGMVSTAAFDHEETYISPACIKEILINLPIGHDCID